MGRIDAVESPAVGPQLLNGDLAGPWSQGDGFFIHHGCSWHRCSIHRHHTIFNDPTSNQPSLGIYAHLLESGLYFYTAGSLIAYMLQDHAVTSDELYAAGATFTLLAWAFAFAFSVCQQWYPGSFTAAVDPTSARSWMELLFLSFSLLSGVGLSDVVPILPQARALVMLEQFAGVMYIAVVVSRLIGLTILKAPARRSE